jgi:hypothetical protein
LCFWFFFNFAWYFEEANFAFLGCSFTSMSIRLRLEDELLFDEAQPHRNKLASPINNHLYIECFFRIYGENPLPVPKNTMNFSL